MILSFYYFHKLIMNLVKYLIIVKMQQHHYPLIFGIYEVVHLNFYHYPDFF